MEWTRWFSIRFNGNMIDAGSGRVANEKSYTSNKYWRAKSKQWRTFRRVLKNPNELVDPKVDNYNKSIGFNGVVSSQGGQSLDGTGSDNTDSTNTGQDNSATTGSTAPSASELGVFDQLSNAMSNIIGSMYNGKQVDLFASSGNTDTNGSSPSDGSTAPVTGKGEFPKYALNDAQKQGFARLIDGEQSGTKARYAEASIAANLTDVYGNEYATVDNLLKRALTGGRIGKFSFPRGWFAGPSIRNYHNTSKKPSQTSLDAVQQCIIEGKRTLPRYVDEHDCFSDISSVTNDGKPINKKIEVHIFHIKQKYTIDIVLQELSIHSQIAVQIHSSILAMQIEKMG